MRIIQAEPYNNNYNYFLYHIIIIIITYTRICHCGMSNLETLEKGYFVVLAQEHYQHLLLQCTMLIELNISHVSNQEYDLSFI